MFNFEKPITSNSYRIRQWIDDTFSGENREREKKDKNDKNDIFITINLCSVFGYLVSIRFNFPNNLLDQTNVGLHFWMWKRNKCWKCTNQKTEYRTGQQFKKNRKKYQALLHTGCEVTMWSIYCVKFKLNKASNAVVWHFKIELNHNCSRYGIKQNAKEKLSVKTHKQETILVYLNNIPSIVLQSINGNIIRCKQTEIERERKREKQWEMK